MTNPELLYRGTPNRNVSNFVPKERIRHDFSEKLAVSATTDRAAATMFIVPIEDLKVVIGSFGGIHYYVYGGEQPFKDGGGAIYTLNPEGFEYNPDIGIWTSPKPVETISQEDIPSGLEAMIEDGIQVFFVDQETFNQFKESPDKRGEMLRNLTSENERRRKD